MTFTTVIMDGHNRDILCQNLCIKPSNLKMKIFSRVFSKILPNKKSGKHISFYCSQKAVTYLFDDYLDKEQQRLPSKKNSLIIFMLYLIST